MNKCILSYHYSPTLSTNSTNWKFAIRVVNNLVTTITERNKNEKLTKNNCVVISVTQHVDQLLQSSTGAIATSAITQNHKLTTITTITYEILFML